MTDKNAIQVAVGKDIQSVSLVSEMKKSYHQRFFPCNTNSKIKITALVLAIMLKFDPEHYGDYEFEDYESSTCTVTDISHAQQIRDALTSRNKALVQSHINNT